MPRLEENDGTRTGKAYGIENASRGELTIADERRSQGRQYFFGPMIVSGDRIPIFVERTKRLFGCGMPREKNLSLN
ncbi:MAG: hypothetical protein C4532_10865 [Candidatus Abyssobacteria bacterium SURF_17]|jgi:hypothetical protein|uniref:Uncharacterized protein n=1 Tax=Candidatus Abyssobacteria bacterium SURF_17 TaxID=2093361 RepID=A0A419EXI0_9BACT|nr:MAG: hypothetical protein C4532_10865 [Candidatus Abyssubacteria bacterium SURF_17]